MEERQLLDVPITERERHYEQQRASQVRNRNVGSYDAQPTPLDFEIYPTPVEYQPDNSDRANRPQAAHQRMPSGSDNGLPNNFNFVQTTNYDRAAKYSKLNHPPELWRPFWIRRTTLALFLFTLLSIVIGIVLLWHYSNSLDGFGIPSSLKYYAWTYAPVAFMVVLVGLWRQADYYFKLLGPWSELRNGPVPASQSLILDYISPINIVSLFTAFKQGYTPIILSIVVFFSLKIMIIFSAALLISLPTATISNSTPAVLTKTFDASSFDPSALPGMVSFSSDPVYSVLGNVVHGIPFPSGVTSDFAYLPVEISQGADADLQNATYEANTEALSFSLSCASVQATVISNTIVIMNNTAMNMISNQLELKLPDGNICKTWTNPIVYALNPTKQITPSRQFEGTMQRVFCANNQDGSKPLEPAGLLFTLTDIKYSQNVSSNGTISNGSRSIAGLTNVLCTTAYHVLNATISNNSAVVGPGGINAFTSDDENRTLVGLSNQNLAYLYDGIMNASQGVFGTRAQDTQAPAIPNTVFNLMATVANETGIESFLNAGVMQSAAESTFRHVMSYYAAQSLTRPSSTNTTVRAAYTKQKIHISFVSFYVILVFAAFSALCTIVLMILTPPPLIPKDPSMMATAATVLARSPELNRLLRNQISTKTVMGNAMREFDFGSAIAINEHGTSSYKIIVTQAPRRKLPKHKRKPHNWWSPNYQLIPALVLAIVVPAALIALLQYLQHRSDNRQGFVTVAVNPYTALYTRCIPVLVMLLVAAMVGIVDFKVALFSPLNKLAEGNANARRSLLSHLLGKLPPIAYYEAFRGRHFGALFSIPAAIIASVFAIIASGLYSAHDMTFVGPPQTLQVVDSFQMNNRYSVLSDRGAAGMLRMIDDNNMGYPRGTFDDLVFPTYALIQNSTSLLPQDAAAGPFTATIPVLRANLKCDAVPAGSMRTTYVPASRSYNTDHWQVDSLYNLPELCRFSGAYRNFTTAMFQTSFNVTKNDTTFFGGKMLDLLFGPKSTPISNSSENVAARVGGGLHEGCPSLAFTFVEIRPGTSPGDMYKMPTSLVCYQQVEQLKANVTFKYNSTELDQSVAPVVLNTSSSFMVNPNTSSKANTFSWRIQDNIERQLFGLDGARLNAPDSASTYQFDAFFSYLFNNTYKRDPATLALDANSQKLIGEIGTVYRKYMAQAINANMRIPITFPQNGVVRRQSAANLIELNTNVVRARLIQNRTSKLTLQILFGVTILFCILAYLFTSFHLLLPYNPATIAGTMSLLAGSDLVWTPEDQLCDCCGKLRRSSWSHEYVEGEDNIAGDPNEYRNPNGQAPPITTRQQTIPDGAEWLEHIQFNGLFGGRVYSLGWWREDRTKGRRRRFGVDIGGRPDGTQDDDWELGDHRPRDEPGFEGFMMRGRSLLGDQRGHYQRAGSTDISTAAVGRLVAASARSNNSPSPDYRHPSSAYTPAPAPSRAPMPGPGPGYRDHYRYRDSDWDLSADPNRSPPAPSLARLASLSPPLATGVMSPRRVRFHDEA